MSCDCVDYGDGCMHDWRPIAMGAQVEGEAARRRLHEAIADRLLDEHSQTLRALAEDDR